MGKAKNDITTAPEIRDIEPNLLTLDRDVQPRCRMSKPLVETYAEAMKDGDQFPAIVAFDDGAGTLRVADGFHRTKAAIKAGLTTIRAEIRTGGKREAVLYAASCNADHGKDRTPADKRRVVTILLTDDEWSGWSDREIARRCRVSHVFVGKVRCELSGNGYQMDSKRKVSRGGKTYSMDTSKIGAQGAGNNQPDPAQEEGDDDPGATEPDESQGENGDAEGDSSLTAQEDNPAQEEGLDDLIGDIDTLLGPGPDDPAGRDNQGDAGEPGDQPEPGHEEESAALDESDGDPTATEPPESEPQGPAAPTPSPTASTDRWLLVRVAKARFSNEQASALQGHLAGRDGERPVSHVLVVREGNETGAYMAYKAACEAVGQAGFPLQFRGQLLRRETAEVYAAVAWRDSGVGDPAEMLRQVLGCGALGTWEEITDISGGS